MSQQNASQKLRQKAISLLYLVFIALVFIYVPADFLDSINDTNRSLEKTSSELAELKKKKFLMYEKSGVQFDIQGMKDSFKYKQISLLTDSIYQEIEGVKVFLVEETGGYNKYGYPTKSKEFDVTDHLMLNTDRASNLKKSINAYRRDIGEFMTTEQRSILDSILIIKEQILSSKGQLVSWEEFYFKKAPLSVTQMMLSKFQTEIRLVEYLLLDKFERKLLQEVFVQAEGINIVQQDEGARIIQLEPTSPNVSIDDEIVVELVPDSTMLAENEENPFEDVTATIKVGSDVTEVEVNAQGEIVYRPDRSGVYTIQAQMENAIGETTVSVFNPHPVINREELEALYMGIRNPLRIETENFDLDDLTITSSAGTIRRINDLYYIKPSEKGEIVIKATVNDNGKETLLSTRKFYVRELPLPYALLNSMRGGEVLADNLKGQRRLLIKSDIYETDNYYNVTGFNLTRIANGSYGVNQLKERNRTANFGASVLELISNAKRGDLYVFNEIEVVGASGERMELQALVFKVI